MLINVLLVSKKRGRNDKFCVAEQMQRAAAAVDQYQPTDLLAALPVFKQSHLGQVFAIRASAEVLNLNKCITAVLIPLIDHHVVSC